MSPAGAFNGNAALAWSVSPAGYINYFSVDSGRVVRPVISLKAGMLATGSGTSDDPYLIQTR